MRRSFWIGVLAAGSVLVAGCSSSPPESTSSESTSSVPGSSSATPSGSAVAPAQLDGQTTAWFETVCGGLGPSIKSMNSLDQTALADPAAKQSAAVGAIRTLQTAFASTATALAAAPPPTFDGGAEFASTLSSGLASAGTQLGPVADKFAAVDPTDAAALSAAANSLQTELTTALQSMDSINQLDPSVSAAVANIPTCKALGS